MDRVYRHTIHMPRQVTSFTPCTERVVVGADENVSNEGEYAVSIYFLPFSLIFNFFLIFCIPDMNCAVDPSEIEIGREDTMPKVESHILYIFRQIREIGAHIS